MFLYLKKEDMKERIELTAHICRYKGPKNTMLLIQHSTKYVLPLIILANQQVIVATKALDI